MTIQRLFTTTGLGAAVVLAAACGGDRKAEGDTAAAGAPAPAAEGAPAAGAGYSTTQLAPDGDGKVITVQMETDAQGNNKFDPANFEVEQGDVIRFTLKSGVHNAHFVADSNPNAGALPTQPSDLLQLPGQTLDVKVSGWAPGKHYFQCDPHALLGMVGHVEVEADDDK
jgi:plastocyanin